MNDSKPPRRRLPILLALLVFVCACTQIRVRSDYDPQADFSRLQTYAWLADLKPTDDPRLDSSLLDKRVRGAVERHLAAKGYRKIEAGGPSFRVAYHVYVQRKTQVVADPVGPYSYRWWGPVTTHTYQYDEGTLLLDIIDPKTNSLMWRGAASATVDPGASVEKREERIDAAVRSLLEKFPPS